MRSQHGGGFVEDQAGSIACERLDDFHTLLDAHGQVLDDGGRIDLEAKALGDLSHRLFRLGCPKEAERSDPLITEFDVLRDGKDRHEHEVLVDHADADLDRVGRAPKGDR